MLPYATLLIGCFSHPIFLRKNTILFGGIKMANSSNAHKRKNTQKAKKPFYKKVWFWIVAVILVLIVGGSLTSNGSKTSDKASSSSSSKSSETSKSSSSSSSKSDSKKISAAAFDAIAVGDNGMTYAEAEAKYGKPTSTSDSSVQGQTGKMATWTNIVENGDFVSAFNLTFVNDKAVGKAIEGLKVSRKSKITLAQYNSIQNGFTRDQVTKAVGNPNGISISSIAGITSEMMTYSSDINGSLGANFIITLSNGKVSSKSQTSMK